MELTFSSIALLCGLFLTLFMTYQSRHQIMLYLMGAPIPPKTKVSYKGDFPKLLTKLATLDYFNYVPEHQRAHVIRESRLCYDPFLPETKRFFPAYSSDIAQNGLRPFLTGIEPFLKLHGLDIEQLLEEQQGYRVVGLTKQTDWKSLLKEIEDFINPVFAQHGITEQIYFIGTQNNCYAVFLTPAMYQAIIKAKPTADQKPYTIE